MNTDTANQKALPPLWRIDMLGGFRVSSRNHPVDRFPTRATEGLLAYLAFHAPHPASREQLIEMLWTDVSPKSGRHNLSMALSFLRKVLEQESEPRSVLIADRSNARLNPDALQTDVHLFMEAIKNAEMSRDNQEKRVLYERACELYQGELLPGFYQDWILPQQLRLEDLYTRAAHHTIQLLEQTGELERALQTAQQTLERVPLYEPIHIEIMRLYVQMQNPAQALRHYEFYKTHLQTPDYAGHSSAIHELAAQIRQQSSTVSAPVSMPVPSDGSDMEAVLDWTFQHAPERALLLVMALTPFWERKGDWQRGEMWLSRMLTQPGLEDSARSSLLTQAGRFAWRLGAYHQANQFFETALEICKSIKDHPCVASVLHSMGLVAHYQCHYPRATTLYQQSLKLWRETKEPRGIAHVLTSLAHVLSIRGQYNPADKHLQEALSRSLNTAPEARALAFSNLAFNSILCGEPALSKQYDEQCLAIRRELNDQRGIAATLCGLGWSALAMGDWEQSERYHTESIAIRRSIGDRPGMAHVLCLFARTRLAQNHLEEVESLLQQSIQLCKEYGNQLYEAMGLEGFACLCVKQNQVEAAARCLRDAESIRAAIGAPVPVLDYSLISEIKQFVKRLG